MSESGWRFWHYKDGRLLYEYSFRPFLPFAYILAPFEVYDELKRVCDGKVHERVFLFEYMFPSKGT